MAALQTLDRGLRALFLIGGAEDGMSVADLAAALEVDRAIAYRIVTTLEGHGLVSRQSGGRLMLGAGVLRLEGAFVPQFRATVQARLAELAAQTGATAFLSMAEGEDCVALVVAEPETSLLRVGYRVGSRHPLERGAAGIAILAGRRARPDDSEDVRAARAEGVSVTRGALQKGAVGVACPLRPFRQGGRAMECSLGVVAMEDLDVPRASALLREAAQELNAVLAG
ncbi:MarR family transcriptional regulator [Thalassobius vesicularis]|uniref:MarR family transcriptional regulator n=1 Tax=Thalassobius vesicularis TaxID=1294297 RepID=A0A4S3M611_9RHOB|nr:helix-turn-helix domain-containing protein [Thalassobius vesicularis]THD71766.1 MarR family transcriptional regulator [Thalassobius vesicularis]